MILAKEFSELYDVSIKTIHTHNFTNNPHIVKKGSRLYVDDKALLRRQEFRRKVYNETIKRYYELLDSGYNEYFIAIMLSKRYGYTPLNWVGVMNKTLFFDLDQHSLLVYKIPMRVWKMFKFFRHHKRVIGW